MADQQTDLKLAKKLQETGPNPVVPSGQDTYQLKISYFVSVLICYPNHPLIPVAN